MKPVGILWGIGIKIKESRLKKETAGGGVEGQAPRSLKFLPVPRCFLFFRNGTLPQPTAPGKICNYPSHSEDYLLPLPGPAKRQDCLKGGHPKKG